MNSNNLIDQNFGRLTVVGLNSCKNNNKRHWDCVCACGNKVTIRGDHLLRRETLSCGCFRGDTTRKRAIEHGESGKTKEYTAWVQIKGRCFNEKNKAYKNYGGRGIGMYAEWIDSYDSFLAYIGRSPSAEHSIERINNNGNYEPGNIKWATPTEQANNKRNNRNIEYNGMVKTLSQWCKILNIPYARTSFRIKANWELSEAFNCTKQTNQYG